jgi:hypothetical protein
MHRVSFLRRAAGRVHVWLATALRDHLTAVGHRLHTALTLRAKQCNGTGALPPAAMPPASFGDL